MFERKGWYAVVGLIAGAGIITMILILSMTRWIPNAKQPDVEKSQVSQNEDTKEYRYQVTSYRGHIGIYDAEGSLRSEVMVSVAELPFEDRELLKKGIFLESEAELYALMEDYTG